MGIVFTISNYSNCSLLQLNEPMRIKAPSPCHLVQSSRIRPLATAVVAPLHPALSLSGVSSHVADGGTARIPLENVHPSLPWSSSLSRSIHSPEHHVIFQPHSKMLLLKCGAVYFGRKCFSLFITPNVRDILFAILSIFRSQFSVS